MTRKHPLLKYAVRTRVYSDVRQRRCGGFALLFIRPCQKAEDGGMESGRGIKRAREITQARGVLNRAKGRRRWKGHGEETGAVKSEVRISAGRLSLTRAFLRVIRCRRLPVSGLYSWCVGLVC